MNNPHSESETGKKIGFVLATIHTGSSLNLWLSVAAKAAESTGSFFVFPGGKLENTNGSGALRNRIYSLVNSKNLDGLISWSSSIGGSVSIKELDEFHKKFASIPFVTIGHKVSNHPYVEFDAYSGMKNLVQHFIKCHNSKRIAFIRGPENHSSAEDRYRAFKDALKENGLNTRGNENLVSSPCSWYEAEKAAKELYEGRGLVPGKDFDTLIASSDLMASAAVDYFSKRGFKVPENFIIGGFNDTVESRIRNPQFSTVHMPQKELGLEAVNMLSQVLNGEKVADKYLSAYPVIRESCGCNNLKNWGVVESKSKSRTREQFESEFCDALGFDPALESTKNRMAPIFDALFNNSRTEFIMRFDRLLEDFFEHGGDLSNVFGALSTIKNCACLPEDFVEKVLRTASVVVSQVQERVFTAKRYNDMQIAKAIGSLKSELLSVHSRKDLLDALRKFLPAIKIKTLSIVLHSDDAFSKYFGGFNFSSADDDFRTEEKLFDSDSLLPEKYQGDLNRGVFVVQPLFMENRSFGYMIANYAGFDGSFYEDLRVAVSNAIQSIMLFEELETAKITAEQAEFEKTEFFANVGSELCDPLKDLSAKVSQMEHNVNEGILDADIIGEQLIFLNSQIKAQLEKTITLVDLTRSQVDDLPMDKKLFDLRQILPANISATIKDDIPLLFGDVERLNKSIATIFDSNAENPEVVVEMDGVHIRFDSKRIDWQRPELLLAEKIILLQYGEVVKTTTTSEIVLSWPNLSGMPPAKSSFGSKTLYTLSNSKTELFGTTAEPISKIDFESESFDNSVTFTWNPDEAPIDEWVKVYSLRRNERFFRAPIICYSRTLIGHRFLEIIEQKVKTQKTSSVLFVGTVHTRYGTWATDANSVYIPSMDNFDEILNEITPSLIVFERISESDIVKIRKTNKTVLTPILVLPDSILSEEDVDLLCSHPKIILCNRGAAESEQFNKRIHGILSGDEILPPHTGALVKKAILYLNVNASQQIVRWKLADTVHVSEDYLTRIFHKELGLSLWEYLNRYRIYLATKMLLETNDTIYEIAENSGFQDQSYFCRVFKKIYGIPPGKIRSKN
ncbi:MAG: substrate-binding domain-containing protein [Treponema sp.]|nr:substrate-binding domain-containing protein [Treponema sp.]